jgi:hypothetical protein
MTTAFVLRSRIMGNCYVRFWIGSEGGDSLTDHTS